MKKVTLKIEMLCKRRLKHDWKWSKRFFMCVCVRVDENESKFYKFLSGVDTKTHNGMIIE